MTCIA
ncbi:hypothetical protein CP061683_1545A, partial [Chlamydia psittaci 06-1683]